MYIITGKFASTGKRFSLQAKTLDGALRVKASTGSIWELSNDKRKLIKTIGA